MGYPLGIIRNFICNSTYIEQDNHFQTEPARRDMLIHWISSGNANKTALIEALKSMNENCIALEIQSQTL